jgi:hypothetical protein
MTDHSHVFDSEQGFLPQVVGLSLRCKCGHWITVGNGKTGRVPKDHSDTWASLLACALFLFALWALG